MSDAPRLSATEIQVEVERLFRREHRSHLVALFGRGEAETLVVDGASWDIVPTRCELDLRAHLPAPDEPLGARRVFLVDWVEDTLPLDISCRLAGGRVYHIARDARLAALFGARQVEPGLAGTALARLLLSGELRDIRKVPGFSVGRDDAWIRLLEARVDLPEEAAATPLDLLRWARTSGRGAGFRKATEESSLWRPVRRELLEWLERRLGPLGHLVWRSWEEGLTDRLLQVLVLMESSHQADPFVQGQLVGAIQGWLPAVAAELRGALPVDPAVLRGALSAETDRRLLEGAEELARSSDVGGLADASRWLPAGHLVREQRLASGLAGFVEAPSEEGLRDVLAALDTLEQHQLDAAVRGPEHRETRMMAARLATWLLGRRRETRAPYGPVWQPAVDLSRRYAEEGGYLDWAQQRLRGLQGASTALQDACKQLLEAVATEARDDDQRFARAYVAWLDKKPSAGAVPIEDVTRRLLVPFLEGGRDRKALLVLMDGMSHASAVQLLHRLRDERGWGLLAWRARDWKGVLPTPPVLAAAPTLTTVSRAAFFAGKADRRFGDRPTTDDAKRWAANPQVAKVMSEAPRLFEQRHIGAGHKLDEPVRQAIDSDDPVVAVIVNGIDSQLAGSYQVDVDYSRVAIRPLEALLSAAEGKERAVLLVADHGHVPGDAMTIVAGRCSGKRVFGARYRALLEGEAPEPDEVQLPDSCWKPRGASGLAVLWDPRLAYKAPKLGEHGGLSLAETVAPAFLIGPDWLERVYGDDVELSMRPLPVPEWWDLRPTAPPTARPAPPEAEPAPQLSLLGASPPPREAPSAAPVESNLVANLRASKTFQQHIAGHPGPEIERVLGWLQVLVGEGGAAAAAEFARRCRVRPHQVSGVVARMGILNADGFAVVEHDVQGRRVVLHRARLVQQFGVDG